MNLSLSELPPLGLNFDEKTISTLAYSFVIIISIITIIAQQSLLLLGIVKQFNKRQSVLVSIPFFCGPSSYVVAQWQFERRRR